MRDERERESSLEAGGGSLSDPCVGLWRWKFKAMNHFKAQTHKTTNLNLPGEVYEMLARVEVSGGESGDLTVTSIL